METKYCPKCQKIKYLSVFYKSKNRKDGHSGWCIKCDKEYRSQNKEKITERKQKYYIENKEEIERKKKEYRVINRERIKKQKQEFYINHKDKIKKATKIYYKTNKEDILKKQRKYSQKQAIYDSYVDELSFCEGTRRDPDNQDLLQVKCTYCNRWFNPTISAVQNRIRCIKSSTGTECRFYCSNSCKIECPIYKKILYSEGTNTLSREVQAELRQMRFEVDNYTCQKCDSKESLHCHHIEGIRWEPLESADIDKVVTVCKSCHKKIHSIEGCKYHDMKCKEI